MSGTQDTSIIRPAGYVPALFALTLFTSAGLLFFVEPMIAKMILPLLGGTPAVWNTCMMFFQALLLGGYIYAHLLSSRLSLGRQLVIHNVLLVIALSVLPVAVSRQWLPSGDANPVLVVLALLAVSVGLPFFVLSSSAPLLQKWFALTGHPSARDPYFLYSASNLGSMLALVSYPALIEPKLPLGIQNSFWAAGYAALLALTLCCSFFIWRVPERKETAPAPGEISAEDAGNPDRPSWKTRLRWVVLSFVPSSLMLGVTTFLSTDIAAIPLFWVIPLALYLLSFILVFAKMPPALHRIMVTVFPFALVTLIFMNIPDTKPAIWVTFLVNLITFFIIAMVCHGELAQSRPHARHLTGFYLWMSFGGVLGGIFNAVIAPLIFASIAEYPLVLSLAAFLLPLREARKRSLYSPFLSTALDIVLPLIVGALTLWLLVKWPLWGLDVPRPVKVLLTYGMPAALCLGLLAAKRPQRFGLGIAALAAAVMITNEWKEDIVFKERSFFGVIKVLNDKDKEYRRLVHGTTQHGKQSLDPRHCLDPLTYYHHNGPIGRVFREFRGLKRKSDVALIGLGIGTLASYGEKGQRFTFYEIDPAIKQVATDPSLFTYLQGCRADWKIVIGDARLKLEKAPDRQYGLIVVDAFSSDAIPVHLITREAVRLYFSKLNNAGVLAIHISNKYLDLEPVIGRIAADAGMAGLSMDDDKESDDGKYRSHWVLLARKESCFGRLAHDRHWKKLDREPGVRAWTDDFSNLLSIFKWG